jgi:hypothetical protein
MLLTNAGGEDTTAPSLIIDAASDNAGTLTGPLSSGSVTDETEPVLTGSLSAALEIGQSVAVYANDEKIGTATTEGTTWSYSTTDLAEGNYTFTARVEVDGTTGAFSAGFDLTVDTTAPTVTVNTLSTSDTTPVVTGTVNDPNATVRVEVNGRTYTANVDGNNNWNVEVTDVLGDKTTYQVIATATDAVGNSGVDASVNELSIDSAIGQSIYGFAN